MIALFLFVAQMSCPDHQAHAMGFFELVRRLHRQVRERALEIVIKLYCLNGIGHRDHQLSG